MLVGQRKGDDFRLLSRRSLLMACEALPSKASGCCETAGKQQNLCDNLIVWKGHGYTSEEGLEVVWQLAASAISLACWVQGHKYTGMKIHINVAAQ